MSASKEETGTFELKANTKHDILVEFCNVRSPADGDEDEALMDTNPGVRLGGAELLDEDAEMEKAVKLASEADVVVAIVGLNADWETEGYDRTTLALPRRTDELVEKVAKANPKTVVVTQSVRFDGSTSALILIMFSRAPRLLCLGQIRLRQLFTHGTWAMLRVKPSQTCCSEQQIHLVDFRLPSRNAWKICLRLVISTQKMARYACSYD